MDRDDELAREIQSHLELEAEERVAEGMSQEDAVLAARRSFGSVASTREDVRAVWTRIWIHDAANDVAYAARILFKHRGFAAAAILTLALGIGATTTVFSVVSAVLIHPLTYPNAERTILIIENVPADESLSGRAMRLPSMNPSDVEFWRQHARTVSRLAITVDETRTMMTSDGTVRLEGARVSPALFDIRNVRPILGRGLLAGEERAGASVIVLGTATWLRYFDAAADVIGRQVVLDGQPVTVVGVMPPAFGDEAFWTPYAAGPAREGTIQFLAVTALLREGTSIDEANVEVQALGARLRGAPPTGQDGRPRFEVVRTIDQEVAAVAPALRLLVAAVAAVLLIVCANVVNLLLVRGVGRRREIAIRRALGAARGRVLRQLVAESLVLSLVGGIAGTALAYWGVQLVRGTGIIAIPSQFRDALGPLGATIVPRADEIAVDPQVLAFALGLSLFTGLISGLAPALRLARVDHRHATRTSDLAGRDAEPAHRRVGYGLAVAQVALATTLLIGGGLLVRTFVNLASVELGFDTETEIFRLVSPRQYPRSKTLSLAAELGTRLRTLPGVEAAGFVGVPPMTAASGFRMLFLPRAWEAQRASLPDGSASHVLGTSPGYLQAMGVTLLDGRWLDERDGPDQPRVVLVNRAWTRRFSPQASPVGMTVVTRGARNAMYDWRIVGVVSDLRLRMDTMFRGDPLADLPVAAVVDLRQHLALSTRGDIDAADRPEADHLMGAPGGLTFAIRVHGEPLSANLLRDAVRDVDAGLAVESVATMGDVVAGLTGRKRFYAVVMTLFGSIAAVIAAIGVYGVLAYAMTQRRHEFGVRLALGAEPRHVLRLAMRHGLLLAGIGLVAGVGGAVGLTRYLAGMLNGVTPLDPVTYVAVAVGFAGVLLLAAVVPARQATRADPTIALRYE